jgi:hypothetical protein
MRETAIAYLNETVDTLRHQNDLSPENPKVTECLRQLAATLRGWHIEGFGTALVDEPALADARSELPRLCGAAECQLEKWWCRKALASDGPAGVLSEFWYLPNYLSLRDAETALAGREALRNGVFLGCGALPLTAILLAQADERVRLRCVDADAEACELAEALIGALGLHDRIAVIHTRAEASAVPEGATVICASLLVAPGLYAHLAASGAARLLIRDVEGVFQWLYRPAGQPGPPFRQRAKTDPSPARINITRNFERSFAP